MAAKRQRRSVRRIRCGFARNEKEPRGAAPEGAPRAAEIFDPKRAAAMRAAARQGHAASGSDSGSGCGAGSANAAPGPLGSGSSPSARAAATSWASRTVLTPPRAV